ncbi:hypothetical protein ACQEV9_15725 [Streptomyces chartreusis]|uniref:hypothetical protein n=1 Tax=Streptomyces chartreusis TaxID=1969 RepID=UPI003D8DB76E
MSEVRTCTKCKEEKPLSEFSPSKQGKAGLSAHCKACRADEQRERHRATPAEVHAQKMRRQRAGVRKDVCVSCGEAIEGEGFCSRCKAAVIILGDTPEALKRASKALAYLQEE